MENESHANDNTAVSIQLPQQLGVVLRKDARTDAAIAWLRQRNAHFDPLEDEWLAGFWLAGSPQEADQGIDQLERRYGLRAGDDFVCTSALSGICGPWPAWIQEDEGDDTVLSVPGTAGPARTHLREAFPSPAGHGVAVRELIERTLAEQLARRD